MATPAFEEIVEDFEFLEDWEDRYRHVIELGKAMPPLADALKVPATKVDGCASQVWLHPVIENDSFSFDGESDAMIVRGLIAVLRALYNGLPVAQVPAWRADHVLVADHQLADPPCLGHPEIVADPSNRLRARIRSPPPGPGSTVSTSLRRPSRVSRGPQKPIPARASRVRFSRM